MPDKVKMISKDTLVPLGLVGAICAGVVWLSNQLTTINIKLDTLQADIKDQWTESEMDNWILRFQIENPDINVPDTDY